MRFWSVSETIRVSSTNPACLFKIGSTLSSIMLQSSRDFPDLLVISTTLVYMRMLLSVGEKVKGTSRGMRGDHVFTFLEYHQPTPQAGECQLPEIGAMEAKGDSTP